MSRALLLGMLLLVGCAMEVERMPSTLEPIAGAGRVETFKSDLVVVFDNGYERKVAAGAQFESVGRIPQGEVLRPKNTVFAVEGKHMHEAYIVVSQGRLVGFYLPVEKSFSPLSRPVVLPF